MQIKIHSIDFQRHDISTRMPFRYGITTMTHLPHLFVRVEAGFSGKSQMGISADHLPPKWFTKDPDKDPLEEIDEMLAVIEKAGEFARSLTSESVYGFWYELYQRQSTWARWQGIPLLLAHFGTSLIERALIDAFCRYRKQPFHELLYHNDFGIEWRELRPSLAGLQPKDLLPAEPLSSIIVRHTVGLVDALTEGEIAPEDRLEDGLPQSLESCIQFYGVNHFKIKVNGQFDQDMERLHAIAALFERLNLRDFAFTLDGNEQFKTLSTFKHFWEAVRAENRLKPFFKHLLFVEQPFHRTVALTEEIGTELKNWPAIPPIIIDESDATLESMPRALALGYRGTSHKNCKGVFKGIINRATINHLNRAAGSEYYLMSGEDLTNIGPVANHQDLVVQAALGNESVERNGHHYFKGLAMFDRQVQEATLQSFTETYIREANAYVRLHIRQGALPMNELLDMPFGTDGSL